MDKKGRSSFMNIWVMIILGILLSLGVVWATSTITTSSGGTSITMNDDTDVLVNVTVNVTTTGTMSNITAVMINLSGSDGLVTKANVTTTAIALAQINTSISNNTVSNYSVVITNSSINWTGGLPNYLMNDSIGGALHYFWFNMSGLAPVKGGNITVTLYSNGSLFDSQTNITININDTFNVNYIGSTPTNWNNMSQNYIYGAINISGNETGTSVNITLSNSTGGGSIMRSNTTGLGLSNASGFIFNYSNLADGLYYLNVTVNSTSLDQNESLTRVFRIDRTAPTVTLTQTNASDATTTTKVTVDIALSDSGSGVLNSSSCIVDSTTATITGTAASQTLTESSLKCGTSYSYAIICGDTAGNSNSAQTIWVSTDPCTGTGSVASGGGSSSKTSWTNTVIVSEALTTGAEPVQRELSAKQRVQVTVAGATHHVGVKSLTGTSAVIEIASNPVEATFNVGDTKKFDLDEDGTYDLSVTLNGIANSKADVSISAISEAVPEDASGSGEGGTTEPGSGSGSGETQPGVEETGAGLGTTGWVVLVVVLVVIIALVVFLMRKRK